MGSSISHTLRAPAFDAASRIARRSTGVDPDGTQMTISGLVNRRVPWFARALATKCLIMCSATSRSAITPLPRFARALATKMLDHVLGDFEVGDHAVAQGPNRPEVLGRLAEHQLGIVADRADFLHAVDRFDRDNRRLGQDHSVIAQVDDGVGRTEIDRQVRRSEP